MLKPIQLKNNLTVIKVPKNNAKTFIVGFVAGTGAAIEKEFHPGISFLVERLFRYGTDKHPSPRHLNTALESIGGTFYSETSHELTHYYLSVPSYHQHKAISVLSEIIQHSYFDEKDIQKEKRLQVEAQNYLNYADSTSNISSLALENLFVNTPLSNSIHGTIDTIVSIDRKDVLEYINHQYKPQNSYLILSGDFETKSIMDLVNQEWGYWNPKNKPYRSIEPENYYIQGELPRIMYKQRGQSHTDLTFAFLLDSGFRPTLPAIQTAEEEANTDWEQIKEHHLNKLAILMVLNAVLGEGFTSRLWSKSVEDEMFFNIITSEIINFKYTGYLQIHGRTSNSQFTFALESVLSVLDALKQTTVSINELAKAKEFLKGKLINEHEDLFFASYWQATNFIHSELNYSLDDLLEKIHKVEAAQVRALALDLFIPQRMAITTVGTAKETRIVDKLIRKYLS